MKKVVCAFALVLVAGLCQAAALNWTITGIKTPTLDEGTYLNSGAALAGAVAYLFQADITSIADVESAILDEKFGTVASQAIGSGTSNSAGVKLLAAVGSYAAPESHNFYVVIFNTSSTTDGYYLIGEVRTATWTGAANQSHIWALSDASVWTPVPEPTSMALLALSAVALSLRRRFHK